MSSANNPRPYLKNLVGKNVVVKLKWGNSEYKGTLVSTDSYMNIQLTNAEEVIDGVNKGSIGEVMIRCNNVMWIAPA